MSLWLQHLLVLALVAACAAVVGWQLLATFRLTRGGGGKLGSCCAKGCDAQPAPPSHETQRIVFIPSSSIGRRK